MQSEILEIDGIDPKVAKLQNINLMFGEVNSIEYCSTMFNFPKLHELYSSNDLKDLPDISNISDDEFDNKERSTDNEDDDL